jgi:hypothetical protein
MNKNNQHLNTRNRTANTQRVVMNVQNHQKRRRAKNRQKNTSSATSGVIDTADSMIIDASGLTSAELRHLFFDLGRSSANRNTSAWHSVNVSAATAEEVQVDLAGKATVHVTVHADLTATPAERDSDQIKSAQEHDPTNLDVAHMRPPQRAEFLLYLCLSRDDRECIPGDLLEEFTDRIVPRLGLKKGQWWYWAQVVRSIVPLLTQRLARLAKWGAIARAAETLWTRFVA